jgi:valyl-tRNA synthetase
LLAEGTTREEIGREKFLERVWEYKAEQGGHITRQLRALGASADWSRERFTMDKDLSEAVTEAFVRLHEKGLVYRGEYMVNWAPLLKTAVSDLEVEYSDEEGKLYYFKYVVEGSDGRCRFGYGISFCLSSVLSSVYRLSMNRIFACCHYASRNHHGGYCRLCSPG